MLWFSSNHASSSLLGFNIRTSRSTLLSPHVQPWPISGHVSFWSFWLLLVGCSAHFLVCLTFCTNDTENNFQMADCWMSPDWVAVHVSGTTRFCTRCAPSWSARWTARGASSCSSGSCPSCSPSPSSSDRYVFERPALSLVFVLSFQLVSSTGWGSQGWWLLVNVSVFAFSKCWNDASFPWHVFQARLKNV